MQRAFPGVWRLTLGRPERFTPTAFRTTPPDVSGLARLSSVEACPFPETGPGAISGCATPRGYRIFIPVGESEEFYGLGLQLHSLAQRGRKKTLRVNSDPRADLGDSHAPVPFLVSTGGWAVLVDTARYATFYCACAAPVDAARATTPGGPQGQSYELKTAGACPHIIVEIPAALGADVYVFAGPTMLEAVQRYNLFSGGGCLPPRWGLGVWYRCHLEFGREDVARIARRMREDGIPCDVIGLEPGWQTHSYSCSFVWSDRFPDPAGFVREMADEHFRVNLWTHAFVHPTSPLHEPLRARAGDYTVWNGLVPDLADPEVRRLYADFHEERHVALGVSGYKLDECDNSDFISKPWSFPELSSFPSGLDGEQMHSLFGMLYMDTIEAIYRRRNTRTYGLVRCAHALAAPRPFVLYSDLYDHREFIRGVVSCGVSGLLWTPEVRHADSPEDLVRRVQTVVFSPLALVNAWYIKAPPWEHWRDELSKRPGSDAPDVVGICRRFFELRMSLIPYLYSAFHEYLEKGVPPFRPLVLDYPDDAEARTIDQQYMMGDRLMVAPVVAGQHEREVYLPKGRWYDFWTGEARDGPGRVTVPAALETIPVFVRGDCVMPLAAPTLHVDDPASTDISVQVYGTGERPFTLIEDDSQTYDYERGGEVGRVTLAWDDAAGTGGAVRAAQSDCAPYRVTGWTRAGR